MRVYVLRHAKSDWPAGSADFDRPLNDRGRREAQRMAEHLRTTGVRPDVVLCSPAARARETLALVDVDCSDVRFPDALYGAEADEIASAVRGTGAATLLVVGHNPGLSDFVGVDLPTCTVATVDLDDGGVTVIEVVRAKDLDGY